MKGPSARVTSLLGLASVCCAASLLGCVAPQLRAPEEDGMTARFVTVDGLQIAYEEKGVGPPVLFVHGFGASSFVWRAVVNELGGHRLIAVDLKGFGNSAKPPDGKYTVRDQAMLVQRFIMALNLDDVVVVGHSLGGGASLMATSALSEGDLPVRGLVLLDTMAYPQEIPSFIRTLRMPVVGCVAVWLLPPRYSARTVLREIHYSEETISEDLVDGYAHYLGLPGARDALLSSARQIVPDNPDEIVQAYSRITVPVLIIWGEHDAIVPIDSGRKLARAIPGSRWSVIEGCGHAPHEERPTETARLISAFLEEIDTR